MQGSSPLQRGTTVDWPDLTGEASCKAYDTNRLRAFLQERGVEAVIPSSARRKPIIAHDRETYRQRNLIERMFARLKDFRRIATRYDKLARNYLTGVILAATTVRWT